MMFNYENNLVWFLLMLFGVKLDTDDHLPDSKDMIQEALCRGREDLTKVISKESIKRLVELLIQITEPQEYSILIDDAEKVLFFYTEKR